MFDAENITKSIDFHLKTIDHVDNKYGHAKLLRYIANNILALELEELIKIEKKTYDSFITLLGAEEEYKKLKKELHLRFQEAKKNTNVAESETNMTKINKIKEDISYIFSKMEEIRENDKKIYQIVDILRELRNNNNI